MSIIQRSLNPDYMRRTKGELGWLLKTISDSHGTMELSLRNDYMNVYHRGNSLMKIEFRKKPRYRITINQQFLDDVDGAVEKLNGVVRRNVFGATIDALTMEMYFTMRRLGNMCQKILETNYSEELALEQVLMADNRNRKDWIVLDRQVEDSDPHFKGKMDLLTARRVKGGEFQFVIVEVKMGFNQELRNKVAGQLQGYVDHIEAHFEEYARCYEKHYAQKRDLGLFSHPSDESITFASEVRGFVVVGGYADLAHRYITELKKAHPKIMVQVVSYELRWPGNP